MTDYKNTPEGRVVRQKYADILVLSRPEPIKPRMAALNRAKIFSPFAALRGYDEEISDQDRVQGLVAKTDLSDEDKGRLSGRLLQVKKGMRVTVRYFKDDMVYPPLGTYTTMTGTVSRIDPVYREIEIRSGGTTAPGLNAKLEKSPPTCISFDDLVQVKGEGIADIEDYPGIEKFPAED